MHFGGLIQQVLCSKQNVLYIFLTKSMCHNQNFFIIFQMNLLYEYFVFILTFVG